MAQSSRPSLVSIASAYVSDESNVVCVLHACTYAQACVHDLCTVIEGWEAWILHTSGANRRRIINALTRTLMQTLVVGVGLTLLHRIRLVVFFLFLLFLFLFLSCDWVLKNIRNCQRTILFLIVWYGLIDVGLIELIRCRLFLFFSFPGYNFSFRNIRNGNFIWNLKNRCWFQIWSNLELVLKKDEIFVSSEFRKFEIVNLLATYIDCIAKVGTKTFFFNSSTSILKFSILWIRRGRSVNPITCFSNPSSSGTKRYSRFVVREVNRHGS